VWESQLSANERGYWGAQHPDEPWLVPRNPPSRETASISPLPIGDERRISVLSASEDSKALYVKHADENTYVWLLDMPDGLGGRAREERGAAADLYELYSMLGQSTPVPGAWLDPEFEPFFPYPSPRL
jgi:hypothetical protein